MGFLWQPPACFLVFMFFIDNIETSLLLSWCHSELLYTKIHTKTRVTTCAKYRKLLNILSVKTVTPQHRTTKSNLYLVLFLVLIPLRYAWGITLLTDKYLVS